MANLLSSIPDVTLQIWKQDRVLLPENDGHLGELSSGYVLVTASVGAGIPVIGLSVKGRDEYLVVKDVPAVEAYVEAAKQPKTDRNLARLREWLERPKEPNRPRVYGQKVGLEANPRTGEPFVTYPGNLLCLAEVVRRNGGVTNQVRIWRVSLVSQEGHFFVTVQRAYETACYTGPDGSISFPRFQKHQVLNDLLVDLVPDGTFIPGIDEHCEEQQTRARLADENEAFVTSFYDARGIGTVLTKRRGPARVYWADCPKRPRRRFIVPGEVIHARFDVPKMTKRPSSFELQAYDVTVVN